MSGFAKSPGVQYRDFRKWVYNSMGATPGDFAQPKKTMYFPELEIWAEKYREIWNSLYNSQPVIIPCTFWFVWFWISNLSYIFPLWDCTAKFEIECIFCWPPWTWNCTRFFPPALKKNTILGNVIHPWEKWWSIHSLWWQESHQQTFPRSCHDGPCQPGLGFWG